MIISTSYKSNHFLWHVIKGFIAFACLLFIYWQLTRKQEIYETSLFITIARFEVISIQNMIFLLLFSLMNWWLEICKWKSLASLIQPISWKQATEQSLTSFTLSLLTPNRIGEYGVKTLFFAKICWKKALLLNALGNYYQLLATVLFGSTGLLFFQKQIKNLFAFDVWLIVIVFVLGTCLLYLLKERIRVLKKIQGLLRSISRQHHTKIAGLSMARYWVFSSQFCLILYWLHPMGISVKECYLAISAIYLLSSIIPMLAFLDVVVKGSVAIWVLSWIGIEPSTALVAAVLMWFFNFIIPSFVGALLILKLDLPWK